MSPAENLAELTRWITENVASLTAICKAARIPQDARQVKRSATHFLQSLEAKDRAAVAAVETIRNEIAVGQSFHQDQTTWTLRRARLFQEIAAHNQVRAVLRNQMAATRQMLVQLKQMRPPAAQAQHIYTPPTSIAASPQPPGLRLMTKKGGSHRLIALGLLMLGIFGALLIISDCNSANRYVAPPQAVPADMELAWQLASYDAGYRLPANNPSITSWRALMSRLDAKVTQNPSQIADMLTAGQNYVKKNTGREVSLWQLATAADRLLTPEYGMGDGNQDFAKVIGLVAGTIVNNSEF